MKSQNAFVFTVNKMHKQSGKLYFWTFTFRDVHSLKFAMRLWNEFLTILKRKIGFRGVRVLELHDEHGCHFHVLTDKRYKIRKILELGARYGFGRTEVKQVVDVESGIKYLCKYLSKPRPPCLKRVRLWAAFGNIPKTRVTDIITDTPFVRILRNVMGKPSPDEILEDREPSRKKGKLYEPQFSNALRLAWEAYYATFDPDYKHRQSMWKERRLHGKCLLSAPWFGFVPVSDVETS